MILNLSDNLSVANLGMPHDWLLQAKTLSSTTFELQLGGIFYGDEGWGAG